MDLQNIFLHQILSELSVFKHLDSASLNIQVVAELVLLHTAMLHMRKWLQRSTEI